MRSIPVVKRVHVKVTGQVFLYRTPVHYLVLLVLGQMQQLHVLCVFVLYLSVQLRLEILIP